MLRHSYMNVYGFHEKSEPSMCTVAISQTLWLIASYLFFYRNIENKILVLSVGSTFKDHSIHATLTTIGLILSKIR